MDFQETYRACDIETREEIDVAQEIDEFEDGFKIYGSFDKETGKSQWSFTFETDSRNSEFIRFRRETSWYDEVSNFDEKTFNFLLNRIKKR